MSSKLVKEAKLRKQILQIIFKYIPPERCVVFLFGSLAQNRMYPSSDIDIGIISGKPLQNSTLSKIREELHQVKTLRDIDITDFSAVRDKEFLRIALQKVKIWHQTKQSRNYLDNLRKLTAD